MSALRPQIIVISNLLTLTLQLSSKKSDAHDMRATFVAMQAELPRCNVAQMVEVQPLLFLGQPTEDVAAQVQILSHASYFAFVHM